MVTHNPEPGVLQAVKAMAAAARTRGVTDFEIVLHEPDFTALRGTFAERRGVDPVECTCLIVMTCNGPAYE
jgi:hypothetical protein